ncbi:MAG: hypothetical protein BRD55_08200 [Bacteroidetes bacterium SW_9_63_38]|nr:MAG: hypothetical protein BRD55_08200 [Bacteroidetes bacterium SW_9_63_38]
MQSIQADTHLRLLPDRLNFSEASSFDPVSASNPPSARDILIESLGGLSEHEMEQLYGPNWVSFATRKVRALRESRKWVYALGVTMGLLAVALPTTAFYHYYQSVESFSLLSFLGPVAAACCFAAVQMGWAAHMYLRWRHQLQGYRALRALGREQGEETPEAAASQEPA